VEGRRHGLADHDPGPEGGGPQAEEEACQSDAGNRPCPANREATPQDIAHC
jgi:hypothetical protein